MKWFRTIKPHIRKLEQKFLTIRKSVIDAWQKIMRIIEINRCFDMFTVAGSVKNKTVLCSSSIGRRVDLTRNFYDIIYVLILVIYLDLFAIILDSDAFPGL